MAHLHLEMNLASVKSLDESLPLDSRLLTVPALAAEGFNIEAQLPTSIRGKIHAVLFSIFRQFHQQKYPSPSSFFRHLLREIFEMDPRVHPDDTIPPQHEVVLGTKVDDQLKTLNKEFSKLRKEFDSHIKKHETFDDQRRDLDTRLRASEAYAAELNTRLGKSLESIADLQRQVNELRGRLPRVDVDPNLNVLDSRGEFPLYRAAAGGHYNDAKRMLEQGANPSMRTRFQWTALHWAAHNGHIDVVRLLLLYRADANAVSDTEKRPLSMAKTFEIRDLLRQSGAVY
ncbi:ankyrin repeat-containing domain protein [Chaetomium tenue]|uniref:Ankyrin repeat-containing domain protein n=1 Tax=Chaetomium tenue TaxID=1854479 RepID=A0ACB7NXG6_9PEZI|nr:ankyrin repeat-containing domain protein [Chaetomium globosum]